MSKKTKKTKVFRNYQCAIFVKAGTIDPRPNRQRTRQNKVRQALKEYA